ncbi:MAG: hypothetical protein NPIRA01_21940 [Nitrospirales bacterium]|nr:MAG: hypothetical protein NPIRA01_21940 [Nitrospirales bacterium]
MTFAELVRTLEKNGFALLKEKSSIRYYRKAGHDKLIRVDYHGKQRGPDGDVSGNSERRRNQTLRTSPMLDLPYSLVIEATDDPTFFGFYFPDLEGFTGTGHSIEDCLYQAKWGMQEHLSLIQNEHLPLPPVNPHPTVLIKNASPVASLS